MPQEAFQVEVCHPKISAAIQEIAFENGWRWNGGEVCVLNSRQPFLNFNEDGPGRFCCSDIPSPAKALYFPEAYARLTQPRTKRVKVAATLSPSPGYTAKCVAVLEALIEQHPDLEIELPL